MWKLITIKGQNIVSFHQFSMTVEQDVATLIFGQNNDNENQKANGSGKSSLIEAVAFGLTGDTLRKVKTDEIINDEYDEAFVSLTLHNDYINEDFVIERRIARKEPQTIRCTVNGQNVVQPSVIDYNRYILDKIGLTKDDIYANYILCRNKYKSFFDSSDKDKKEIINRFSNGILVDESIAKLQLDIEPAYAKLIERENAVSKASGKVDAVNEQINNASKKNEEFERSKESAIQSIQTKIYEKRNEITSMMSKVMEAKQRFELIDGLGEKLEDMERSGKPFEESYHLVKLMFDEAKLDGLEDYSSELSNLSASLKDVEADIAEKKALYKRLDEKRSGLRHESDKIEKNYQKKEADSYAQDKADKEAKNKIEADMKSLTKVIDEKTTHICERNAEIEKLEKLLAKAKKCLYGAVSCPKCGHQFSISTDKPIDEIQQEADDYQTGIDKLKNENERVDAELDGMRVRVDEMILQSLAIDKKIRDRAIELDELYNEKVSSRRSADNADNELSDCNSRITSLQTKIDFIQGKIDSLRKRMFDNAFNVIDSRLDAGENYIKNTKENIGHAESVIEGYRERIKDLENSKNTDVMASLEEAKKSYEKELEIATAECDKAMVEYKTLKEQEAHFTAFKTHLANTKIDAISAVTNEYLERIGSDLRVALDGFKVLKSGKIRDKITVNVLRNGVDCGSIEKLSAGEKTRICLASIIALQHLTNSACDDGKGLDLVIADEILDASDIDGLMSYCEAINHLQMTALIITQNAVSENYTHKLIVTKQNGVSTINNQ